MRVALIAFVCLSAVSAKYFNEYKVMDGHSAKNNFKLALPHTYIAADELPKSFDWSNVNGTSLVTKSLNQHLPQYCGSCWAHGAMSSLADRIKIARQGRGVDINLAIQYILNCGTDIAGSCHGGSHTGAFEFVKKSGHVPFDTCLQYEACSAESTEGSCSHGDYTCKSENICRTCSTFSDFGGFCAEIAEYPNATIAEYGEVPNSVHALKAEIFARGPVACGVNAEPILEYAGGIYDNKDESKGINHIVSTIGWGYDEDADKEYWIVRNSWGEYWGELGYVRIATGDNQLGIEANCAWATPGSWTERNYPCYEDGSNCKDARSQVRSATYVDPALNLASNTKRGAVGALTPSMA